MGRNFWETDVGDDSVSWFKSLRDRGEKKAHNRSMLTKANQTQLHQDTTSLCSGFLNVYHIYATKKNTEDDLYWVKYELTMLGQDWFSR